MLTDDGSLMTGIARGFMVIRIVLAEDMHMIRGALVALLEIEADIEVAEAVSSGDDILPAVARHRPDVAVLDIALPGTDGSTAAAQLHESWPATKTLMLTAMGHPGNMRRAMSMHVSGLLLKDAPPERLANAIRTVASGRRVIDPELALAAWETHENPLTDRELQTLRLAADGAEVKEIADRMCLAVGTVRNHLTSVVTKLHARNRVDAVRVARESGWL